MTHIIVIVCSTAHFVSTFYFQLNTDFPSQFCFFFFFFFAVKLPSVTQRSVSQENAFKNSKNPLHFFRRTICSNNSLTVIENNIRFLTLKEPGGGIRPPSTFFVISQPVVFFFFFFFALKLHDFFLQALRSI